MTIYISGPMTGIRNFNHGAFEKAHKKLEKAFNAGGGFFKIISPVKIAETVDADFSDMNRFLQKNQLLQMKKKPQWEDYMKACLKRLPEADFVFLLKGWQNSRGAALEIHIADKLGIPHAESIEELKQKMEEVRI
ncbi:MAG: DUF4406 domain-containing protein [Spirochaetaceae bacterium]|jgi:hypothetical protein|nr:DUF4406 domain-containing protein [Spirochaetaceae bacterium]